MAPWTNKQRVGSVGALLATFAAAVGAHVLHPLAHGRRDDASCRALRSARPSTGGSQVRPGQAGERENHGSACPLCWLLTRWHSPASGADHAGTFLTPSVARVGAAPVVLRLLVLGASAPRAPPRLAA
jgi:hypothetical protein